MSNRWEDIETSSANVRRFRNFEVFWAGPGRSKGEFCFGSEDGRILLTDAQLSSHRGLKESPVPSGEAIGGVAFLDNLIALCTRCEVAFVTQMPEAGKGFRSVFPVGAHGVIATPSGHCVAPLGRSGMMVVKPSAGQNQPVTVKRVSDQSVDFYSVVHIAHHGGEVLVSAARKDGMLAVPFDPGRKEFVSSLTYPGLDIVDVCSLGDGLSQPAVAATSRDCTIILSADALHDQKPVTIKFDDIRGTAYRIMNYKGNLILLTSKAIYVLAGLGRRFLDGKSVGREVTPAKAVVLKAVDANIVDEESLLVVAPEGVILFDLESLIGTVPNAPDSNKTREITPRDVAPPWQPHRIGMESESYEMAATG
jgi:hypothetical protein